MKSEVENLSGVERRVSIEVPWEVVREELDEAYRALGRKAKVKGFRPGRVPRKVLEKFYRQTVEGEVLNRLIDDGYRKAIEENELFPIDRPVLDGDPKIATNQPLKFAAKVEVKPEVEVETWQELEVTKVKASVSDEAVQAELQQLREKAVVVEPVADRTEALHGDLAVVDFFGFVDGESFKGGKGINYTVELGGNEMIPGFEEQIVGMSVGDHKEFELAFPEGSGPEEVQGKTVEWKVDLKELKTKIYPDLDDEFAKDLGEFDTLAELEAKVRENLTTREDAKAKRGLRDSALEALVEANPIDVPPAMVERQVESSLQDMAQALGGNQDPKLQEVFAKLREDFRPQARKQVAGSLLLEAIAKSEGLEATDDEVDNRIEELAREHKMQPKQVKQQLRQNDQLGSLRYAIVQDKALDKILDAAKVVEKEPEPEPTDASRDQE